MANYGPTPAVASPQPLYARHVHGEETIDFIPDATIDYGAGVGNGVPFGGVVVVGQLAAIAIIPLPAGVMGALAICGVFSFPKANGDAGLTSGALAFWDNTNHVASSIATENSYLGKVEPPGSLSTDLVVRVSILPLAVAGGSGPNTIVGGVTQAVTAVSATQNYGIGSILDLPDGRRFRYAQAGAANITRALMQQSAAVNTSFTDITQTGHAQVVGATAITVLCTTGSANPVNYFAGGKLIVTTGSGSLGDIYDIVSSALEVTDTLMDLVLAQPLRNAIAATSKVTLIPNRWSNTIVVPATTATGAAAGVPLVDVTAANYYWSQTKGPAPLIVDTGDTLVVGGKAGIPATNAVAGACGTTTATLYAFPVYGTVMWIAAAAEPALISLELE